MTELSLLSLARAFLFGNAAAVVYDPFTALFSVLKRKRFLRNLLDFLYFFLLSLVTYSFFLLESYGEVRFLLCLFAAAGGLFWHFTAGRILQAFFRLFWKGVFLLFYPIKILFRPFSTALFLLWEGVCRLCDFLKRNVKIALAKDRHGSV